MAHVVTERCVDCRYTDCCAVCPVDCFYEIESPAMLVIDPDVCIDCGLCVPECPIAAIWPEDELPDAYSEWLDRNGELFGGGTMIKTKKDALPGAFSLSQLQARERERGLQVTEPSDAAGDPADAETESVPVAASTAPTPVPIANPIATPEGLTVSQVSVFEAAANTIYRWRTVRSVAQQVRLAQGAVQGDLEKLVELGHIQKRSPKTDGAIVYGAVARVA
ncbi:MAG: ferredoxin family protein [Planctomycetes bacterium]|nr:ferredoxin family protein [Planctomycetota bacterium]